MKKPANHCAERVAGLSAEQVQGLLAQVLQSADRARRDGNSRAVVDEIIVLTLLHGGLRARELCALRIADTPAHHGRPELHVRGSTGAARTVLIPRELIPAFQRFAQRHRKGARPSDPLLVSERGTSFSYMSLYSKVRRIGQEAGIPALRPALLRHSFLIQLYEKEQDLRFVQEQAGHARSKSTARHVRPRPAVKECDACGKPVAAGQGEKIDSGHLLCPKCVSDLRAR